MPLILMLILACAQVSTSSFLKHNITKREASGHTACMAQSAAAKPVAMTDAERKEIVDHHNKLRASVTPPAANMLQMRWDSEIEMIARRWADACSLNSAKSFYHDDQRHVPGRFPVGQNLAWGAFPNFTAATDAWFSEKVDYDPYFNTELSRFPSGNQIGHYTQLVWADSALIGCAATKCDAKNFYVCNYAPSGNIMPFKSPYRAGATTGDSCKTRTSNGLCDCGDLACENYSATNVSSCTCKCDYAVHIPPVCNLDCSQKSGTYCGTQNNFMESDCIHSYMLSACPHLCGICPCADKTYKSVSCSGSNGVGATGQYTWLFGCILLLLFPLFSASPELN